MVSWICHRWIAILLVELCNSGKMLMVVEQNNGYLLQNFSRSFTA